MIIKTVAEYVSISDGHTVDLKNYDRMIIIECYKVSCDFEKATVEWIYCILTVRCAVELYWNGGR